MDGYNKLMKLLGLTIFLVILVQLASPWCLKTTVNYTT